jgi:hypothetical protein
LRIPRRKTAERYGVSVRTVERWESDSNLEFPKSIVVRGRRYDDVDQLDEWDAKCATAARATKTPPAAGNRAPSSRTSQKTARKDVDASVPVGGRDV